MLTSPSNPAVNETQANGNSRLACWVHATDMGYIRAIRKRRTFQIERFCNVKRTPKLLENLKREQLWSEKVNRDGRDPNKYLINMFSASNWFTLCNLWRRFAASTAHNACMWVSQKWNKDVGSWPQSDLLFSAIWHWCVFISAIQTNHQPTLTRWHSRENRSAL